MKDYVAVLAVLTAAMFSNPVAADAPPSSIPMTCYEDGEAVFDALRNDWSETEQSVGLTNGAAVVMFANEATGTWTLLAALPTGEVCQIASGSDYENLRTELPANL